MSNHQPDRGHHYSGQMLRSPIRDGIVNAVQSSNKEVFEFPSGRWKYVWYESEHPLPKDEKSTANKVTAEGKYEYPFLLRESEDRFILMSLDETLISSFTKDLKLTRTLQRPKIDIGALVRDLVSPPMSAEDGNIGREYLMSRIWAAVDGYGRALRTISFSGDDLAEAQLFASSLKVISPFRVVLRDAKTEAEVISIGSNGELSMYYRGPSHLSELDRLLKFLTRRKYISW